MRLCMHSFQIISAGLHELLGFGLKDETCVGMGWLQAWLPGYCLPGLRLCMHGVQVFRSDRIGSLVGAFIRLCLG